jgi:hypothetical protein
VRECGESEHTYSRGSWGKREKNREDCVTLLDYHEDGDYDYDDDHDDDDDDDDDGNGSANVDDYDDSDDNIDTVNE